MFWGALVKWLKTPRSLLSVIGMTMGMWGNRGHSTRQVRTVGGLPQETTFGEARGTQMNLLALDLGTKTGWATRSRGHIASGTQSFTPGRFEGGGFRFLRFQQWLTGVYAVSGFEIVVFEEVRRHLSTDSAHAYGGYMATLTAWCEQTKIPYQGVPVGTIKKYACGKGNASKEEMIAAMRAKGHTPKDDNEADALALLCWGVKNAVPARSRRAPPKGF